jgi:hypothetical protein
MTELSEQDYHRLRVALVAWYIADVGARDEQLHWSFTGGRYCASADEWRGLYDPEGWLERFLTRDVPRNLAIAFYVHELPGGLGELTVLGQLIV